MGVLQVILVSRCSCWVTNRLMYDGGGGAVCVCVVEAVRQHMLISVTHVVFDEHMAVTAHKSAKRPHNMDLTTEKLLY